MKIQEEEKGIKLLEPDNINLELDDENELNLELIKEDERYEGVQVNPAFPLSQIGRYLSFREEDGTEIGMLKDIKELDTESKKAIEVILEKMYFMPRILKINEVQEEFGVTRWEVETEKGARAFDIRSRRRDIRPYDNGRVIFHDVDGNRYEITDFEKLDKKSRKLLRSEI